MGYVMDIHFPSHRLCLNSFSHSFSLSLTHNPLEREVEPFLARPPTHQQKATQTPTTLVVQTIRSRHQAMSLPMAVAKYNGGLSYKIARHSQQ